MVSVTPTINNYDVIQKIEILSILARYSTSGFHFYIKTGIFFILYPITYQNIKTELKNNFFVQEGQLFKVIDCKVLVADFFIIFHFVMTSLGNHGNHCFLAWFSHFLYLGLPSYQI